MYDLVVWLVWSVISQVQDVKCWWDDTNCIGVSTWHIDIRLWDDISFIMTNVHELSLQVAQHPYTGVAGGQQGPHRFMTRQDRTTDKIIHTICTHSDAASLPNKYNCRSPKYIFECYRYYTIGSFPMPYLNKCIYNIVNNVKITSV